MEGPRRRIIREHEFEEQLSEIIRDAEEADDFLLAAEVVLSESPTSGMLVDAESGIHVLVLPPYRGRGLKLYYTFDEAAVLFMYIVAFD